MSQASRTLTLPRAKPAPSTSAAAAPADDDMMHAMELGVDADEEKLGITRITALRFRRCTMVVLETVYDEEVVGVSVRNPWRADTPQVAHVVARMAARRWLLKLRERQVQAVPLAVKVPL